MNEAGARHRLEAEAARLRGVLSAAAHLQEGDRSTEGRTGLTADQHPLEQTAEAIAHELERGVAERAQGELVEVEKALSRLRDGRYGICEVCTREIGEERLEAIPAARYCVEDQAKVERDPRRWSH